MGTLKKAANNAGKRLLAPQWPHGWTYADEAVLEQESHRYQASMKPLLALIQTDQRVGTATN
jgi:hypothetical protein